MHESVMDKQKNRRDYSWQFIFQNDCFSYKSCSIDPTTWVSKAAAYIARRRIPFRKRRDALALILWRGLKMLVQHWQLHQPGSWLVMLSMVHYHFYPSLTDLDCDPESATSVSTFWTGWHAHDGVVTPRGPTSVISFLVLLLVWISRIRPN